MKNYISISKILEWMCFSVELFHFCLPGACRRDQPIRFSVEIYKLAYVIHTRDAGMHEDKIGYPFP